MIVTQSGPGSCYNWDECFSAIHQTLKSAFSSVIPFTTDIPSFGTNWAFNLAFEGTDKDAVDLVERSSSQTNDLIAERISGKLKFYDGVSHRGLFGVSKPVRDGLASEKRVITVDDPVFMY